MREQVKRAHRSGWLAAAMLAAAPAIAGGIDEPLRATLLHLAQDDQEAVRIAVADPAHPLGEAAMQRTSEIHDRNAETIRRIVREHGWPGIGLVGEDGSHAAWLVVQHMDTEPEFQKSCLSLMQQAFQNGEVRARDLAYLTDRVLTSEGKPQMYGTQGLGVRSPADEVRIDGNRAAIGLEPWRDAVEKRKKQYANGYDATAVPERR